MDFRYRNKSTSLNIHSILDENFFSPIKEHIICFLVIVGLVTLIVGQLLYIHAGWEYALILKYIGTSIIGGGVASAILKSVQFSNFFKQHIFNVIFIPDKDKLISDDMLNHSWKTVTLGKLKKLLPDSYVDDVQKRLFAQFFNEEKDYLFEKYRVYYEFTPRDDDPDLVEVQQYTETDIKFAPHAIEPILKQQFNLKDGSPDIEFRLDDVKVEHPFRKEEFSPDCLINIKLKEYNPEGKEKINLKRKATYTQNIRNEPYFIACVHRFVKGAQVTVRCNNLDNYQLYFKKFAVDPGKPLGSNEPEIINNTKRWTLVDDNNLLLPGDGYILLLIPFCK